MSSYKQYFIATLLLSIISSTAFAVDLNGYFRAGVGSNTKGGDQVCFKLPGAGSKYRLGNECEAYGELSFSEQVFKDDDGAQFKVSALMAFVPKAESDFEQYEPAWRELYVEGEKLLDGAFSGVTFWAGKRFYRRHDVHISDFFFWDNTGPGAGLQDLDVGFAKLAYAYRRNVTANDRAITSHDFRFYDIETNSNGKLTAGLNIIRSDESQAGFNGNNGYQLHLVHLQDKLWGGFNKLAIQYGQGAGASLNNDPDDTKDSSSKTWRVVEQLLVENETSWSAMATMVFERQENVQDWYSMGVRPVFYLSKHLSLAIEIGHDVVKPANGASRQLSKLTIAPQLSKGRGFWSRPVLRAFVTYANWNGAARDAATSPVAGGSSGVFGAATNGLTYGFKAEAWW